MSCYKPFRQRGGDRDTVGSFSLLVSSVGFFFYSKRGTLRWSSPAVVDTPGGWVTRHSLKHWWHLLQTGVHLWAHVDYRVDQWGHALVRSFSASFHTRTSRTGKESAEESMSVRWLHDTHLTFFVRLVGLNWVFLEQLFIYPIHRFLRRGLCFFCFPYVMPRWDCDQRLILSYLRSSWREHGWGRRLGGHFQVAAAPLSFSR